MNLRNEEVLDIIIAELRNKFRPFKCTVVAAILQDDVIIPRLYFMNYLTIPSILGEETMLSRIFGGFN